MIKKIQIPLMIVLFFYISCKKKEVETNNKIKSINLLSNINKDIKLNLSEIADSIEYIQLETQKNCLLSTIRQPSKEIQFFDNKILINSGNLLLFDNKGDFLNKIGEIGKAPNEYSEIQGFTSFSKKKDTLVAVFSGANRKTLLYSLKGKYLQSFPVNFWPSDLTSISEHLIYINIKGGRKESDYFSLSFISPDDGKLKKRTLSKENEKQIEKGDINKLDFDGRNNFYKLGENLKYWETGYDTIWKISKKLDVFPEYYLNIGKNKMPIEEQVNGNIFKNKNIQKYNSIQKYFESNRYLFVETLFNKRLHRILYDKHKNKSTSLKFKKINRNGVNFSFYNDIDGGTPFWPQGKVSDDKVFMLVYGYELKDYIQKIGSNYSSKNKPARKRLLKLVEKSKISDNPILMVVTLKK